MNVDEKEIVKYFGIAIITFLATNIFNYLMRYKPRLYVSMDTGVLYNQQNDNYQRFKFTYTCELQIKNNSKYIAENIGIVFIKGHELSDLPATKLFKKNNHLESYQEISFETGKMITVNYEDVVHVTYEDGVRVITPGTKMVNPPEYFKPESLKNILFILKYRSEKNKTFYTLYQNLNGVQKNKHYMYNPLIFLNNKIFKHLILYRF